MDQIDVSEQLMDDLQEAKRDGESDEALLRTMLNQYDPENADPGYRDQEILQEMYWDQGMAQEDIASEFGVDGTTINDWMKEHSIRPKDRE